MNKSNNNNNTILYTAYIGEKRLQGTLLTKQKLKRTLDKSLMSTFRLNVL